MALCTQCGTDVGCSCNLIPMYDYAKGLCQECHNSKLKAEAIQTENENVNIPANNTKPVSNRYFGKY